ncbi:MAG: FG-GAP-like repeat-containing protein, partial [Sphingomonadaceae bacterium]|nr:FG-GAP-like repeat-containing protein [Sphingomonadaceae bacterium]
GRADLVVAAPFGAAGSGAGQVYIFSGSGLTGSPVRTLTGAAAGDRFGFDVGVGNIGGDAKADVLVGAPGVTSGNANGGAVYGFFGGGLINGAAATPTGSNGLTLTISNSEGTVAYPNAAGDLGPSLGAAVAILGDVNADGRNDYFVAVPGLNAASLVDVGESYVGFGQTSYPGSSIGVGTLATPGMGFRTQSEQTNDSEGFTAAASGDVNGSGGADLVIADARLGSVVVRFGDVTPSGTTTQNSDLTGGNGVRLFSSEANARFGESIAVGDINNDGRADIMVGAPGAGGDGKVYVLLGAASYAGASIDVANPSGGTVIEIDGSGGFGTSVAFIGDFNGDGRGDFAVGAPTDGASGSAYIMLGSAAPSAGAFALASSANVIKLSGGAAGTGIDVAGPGDLNGDGRADVAIGAANDGSNSNGAVYVVYGRSVQTSSAVGQEMLALSDGSNDIFGGDAASGAIMFDAPMASNDLPPPELFI